MRWVANLLPIYYWAIINDPRLYPIALAHLWAELTPRHAHPGAAYVPDDNEGGALSTSSLTMNS